MTSEEIEKWMDEVRAKMGVQSLGHAAWNGGPRKGWWSVFDAALDANFTAPTLDELEDKVLTARQPACRVKEQLEEHRKAVASLEAELERLEAQK